jgi:phosphogluconate dehydratase
LVDDFANRAPVMVDLSANANGMGRELFEPFRRMVGPATTGAALVV